MKLLMLSGVRAVAVGERGPFFYMQEEFSRHWERIDVLCPRPSRPVTVRTIHGKVHFHPSPTGRAGMVGFLTREGRALLALHRHDLIVSHDYGLFYNGVAASRLAAGGTPWVSEIHHVPGYPRAATLRERLDPWLNRRFVRFALRRGVRAFRVVNRREMVPFLERCGVPLEKILVLSSLYLDLDTFRPEEGAAKRFDVAFVGRMVPNKGIGMLLEALALLRKSRPRISAVLVGSGPLRARLESRMRSLGLALSVTFLDWVAGKEELAELYRSARVVVCASFNEGGPRVTCEAMACGTPCVSTPVGVMPDLIRHGENGWLCDFDAGSLAATLRSALEDEAAYARCAASSRAAVEPFSYRTTIAAYARGLQEMARVSGSNSPSRAEMEPDTLRT
jgi:glycosyltransferase involved in cell wall biosynthesis